MEPESQPSRTKKDNGRRRRFRFFRRRVVLDFVFRSHWFWGVVFALVLTGLLTPGLRFEPVRYELGTIAPVDIRAPYDFNNQASVLGRNAISTAFELGREKTPEGEELDDVVRDQLFLDLRDALGVQLSESEFAVLVGERFRSEVEQALTDAVGDVLGRDIVASKERLEAAGRPFVRRDESTRVNLVVQNFSNIITTEEAELFLNNQISQLADLRPASRRRLEELGGRFILPTLTFNFVDTERQRQAAREEVQPVYFQVRKGRVIVRAGDEVTENVIRQLEVLSAAEGAVWRVAKAAGAFIISAVLMLCLWKLMRTAQSSASWRRRSFVLVGFIIVLHLALARLVFFVAGALSGQIMRVPFNNETSYRYIVPFAAVAILVRLLESRNAALLASVIFSVLLGLMSGDLYLGIFCLLSCLGAILGYLQYKQRTALIKAGLFVGSVNIVNVLGINLLTENVTPGTNFGFDMLCAFVGGAGVAIVVSFLLPTFESFFQRTTDIKLLELSNHNIPILRRLTIEAPGTYHHSVVVGTLSESAAEAIGANAIFCRTAALYHDVGKLQKVDYFVENQLGPNKHDKLSPRMSALIIASHVKEGIEMAEEIDLPQEIIDIIPQHHGTKLITYFYEKAKERQDPSLGDVSEEEFRYPGPKPQTKEAGIIMIADGVEAAARTLEEPSPARLKGVIRQIIDYIFLDGQLDECDLTLRDLERISQSFLRVLMGMHHHRVDYPGFDFEKKVEPVVVQDQNKKVRGVGADR
jgi:putative nucleotidyltransferase with HDIG domain